MFNVLQSPSHKNHKSCKRITIKVLKTRKFRVTNNYTKVMILFFFRCFTIITWFYQNCDSNINHGKQKCDLELITCWNKLQHVVECSERLLQQNRRVPKSGTTEKRFENSQQAEHRKGKTGCSSNQGPNISRGIYGALWHSNRHKCMGAISTRVFFIDMSIKNYSTPKNYYYH